MTKRPRIVYAATHDPTYPRNSRIRSHLEMLGYNVEVIKLPQRGKLRNCAILLRRVWTAASQSDCEAVFLAEFSLEYFLIAWLAARTHRKRVVTDWFVGLEETRVEDHQKFAPNGAYAKVFRVLDLVSVRFADLVFTDTEIRSQKITRRYGAKSSVLALPVGAPPWAIPPSSRYTSDTNLHILYYGNYVPLHSVDTMLLAVSALSEQRPVHFRLIGDGPRREQAEAAAELFQISHLCSFRGPVPEQQLRDEIVRADVVFGILGDSPKAQSVIANKVWQSLACGAHVVTRKSQALDEIEDLAGSLLSQVDPSKTEEIVAALVREVPRNEEAQPIHQKLETYVNSKYEKLTVDLIRGLTAER